MNYFFIFIFLLFIVGFFKWNIRTRTRLIFLGILVLSLTFVYYILDKI
jgi:hypothetical protein